MFFYTSRNLADFYTQHIGVAVSNDLIDWMRLPVLLSADPKWYMTETDSGETSVHAWRDPFIFEEAGDHYMLLGAKAVHLPRNQRGAIALLRAVDSTLTRWKVLPPAYAPGCFGEIELPQMYRNKQGSLILCFNSHARYDVSRKERKGGMYLLNFSRYLLSGRLAKSDIKLVTSTEQTGAYGFRVIPELNGLVVGFDKANGGFVRTNVYTELIHASMSRGA
jgi:beta-fructofuranosidase